MLKNGRILIVDDEREVLSWMCELFQEWGYTPICVDEARIVQDLVRLNTFEIIFLDIALPVINGIELMRHLKDAGEKNARYVCISGYAEFLGEDIENAGFDNILQKPFTAQDLQRLIATHEELHS